MRPIKNILLVDDDPISNMINEKIIQISESGLEVDSYLDANAALDHLKQVVKTDLTRFPNAVFLDINIPDMSGWEFFEELNKFPEFILKECKVIMLTSSIDQEDIEKSKSYNMVYDFISKPLTVEKIKMLLSAQYGA